MADIQGNFCGRSQRCVSAAAKTTSFPLLCLRTAGTNDRLSNRVQEKKQKQRTTWQDTQCLSAMHEGSPAEAVARLPEHEALTALPKANVNLYRWNGVGDVW